MRQEQPNLIYIALVFLLQSEAALGTIGLLLFVNPAYKLPRTHSSISIHFACTVGATCLVSSYTRPGVTLQVNLSAI